MNYIQTGAHVGGRNDGKRKYKSRKLSFEKDVFQPMGFIKLMLLSQESIEAKKVEDEKNRLLKLAQIEEDKKLAEKKTAEKAKAEAERLERERIEKEEAKKPKMYEGLPTKGLEVDAEVVISQKTNKVKIFVKGFEEKLFEMGDSALQPKSFICRVSLVMEKGRIVRVSFKIPK